MDATTVYPNWPPVVATTGLAGAIAGSDPDTVPLNPQLVSDPRRRYTGSAVDAYGVLQLHVRNRAGYAFLREHKRMKLAQRTNYGNRPEVNFQMEATFYQRRYREYVPNDILVNHLEEGFRPEQAHTQIPKWQGNAIAGACNASGDHIVFFPTGEVLQQACAFYNANGTNVDSNGGNSELRSCTSNKIETGTTIRQFAVMGRSVAHQPIVSQEVFVAARGAAHCTVLQASTLYPENRSRRSLKAKVKLTFSEMLYHVAASPHAEAELAFVTGDGIVHWWEPESGIQTMDIETSMASERLLRCEYSSHPCVLWTANRFTVRSVDLREKAKSLGQYDKLFDLGSVGSPLAEIYDVKRRSSCPFQFVVGSGVSIEMVDCRMPMQPLISWAQPISVGDTHSAFGAIEELDLATNANESRGAIVSTSQLSKVATVYPFERAGKEDKSKALSLSSIRSIQDHTGVRSTHTSQFVISDAPLDLQLLDGGEWTNLLGVCALPLTKESSKAARRGQKAAFIYQINDLGDLFSQDIHAKGRGEVPYDAAVQLDLPLGATSLSSSEPDRKRKQLPIPVDAILPEHDTASITPFVPLAVKLLRYKFPRLPNDGDDDKASAPEPSLDEETLVSNLLSACRPSATLFRLQRHVNEALQFPISSQDLLLFLRSCDEFQVRNAHHAYRQRIINVLPPNGVFKERSSVHERGDDPRLAVCECPPNTVDEPCESFSCIVPHAIVVSRAIGLQLEEVFPNRDKRRASESEFASIVQEARELYGTDGV